MKKIFLLFWMVVFNINSYAQTYTRIDSLRGSITPERSWWDLTYYHLDIEVHPETKNISGSVLVMYKVIDEGQVLQIDLQKPLTISKIEQDQQSLEFRTEGNAHFISLKKPQLKESIQSITVHYAGKPREAENAPWDGGISWKTDSTGNPFIASSCQGLGASVWWPCKDHMYDEVDSVLISVEVPQHLINVSNGRLRKVETNKKKNTKTFHWFVNNPISNYGISINIGDYVNWHEKYQGEKGNLDITYWVLRGNKKKAKVQYEQVSKMLDAFEHWFGPYPFYEDGYQLIEAPYLGMEHQSSITYGNYFKNGYKGRDLSKTGWGMKFDFIIIHESGHEWFANNITHQDAADLWIHESFTAYSESLYLEYYFGKEAGLEYLRGTRINIKNQTPLIGPYHVNYDHPDIDIYYKGSSILNMIRFMLNDDNLWRETLRGINEKFYHQTVGTDQIENYLKSSTGLELNSFFDQYLRTKDVPILEYYFKNEKMFYRWTNCLKSFNMKLDAKIADKKLKLQPTSEWSEIPVSSIGVISLNENYYFGLLKSR
ncbi:MAG: M1 family metallopeptidase [Reichenbachiella sp.]